MDRKEDHIREVHGIEEVEKLKDTEKVGDYYDEPEFCPKCPPSLSRRQFTRRNHLIRHLTSKKHGMSKEDARRMAYGEEVPEENPNKVSEEIPEENPDKVSEEITNNDEVKK